MEQAQSSWQTVASTISGVAREVSGVVQQVAPTAVGAAIMGGGSAYVAKYITSSLVSTALQTLIGHSHSSGGDLLHDIKADTEALVRAPYLNAVNLLADAEGTANAKRRWELIDKASDEFREASTNLEARGQARDLFARAQAEYYLGNCSTILGRFDEAHLAYQRAHASATNYLLFEGAPPHLAWNKLVEAMAKTKDSYKKSLMISSPALIVALVNPLAAMATWGTLAWTTNKIYNRAAGRAREEFVETVTPVLDFTASLQQLQINTPDLALEFDNPSLTLDTLLERLASGKELNVSLYS
jgi:hypothetical protein